MININEYDLKGRIKKAVARSNLSAIFNPPWLEQRAKAKHTKQYPNESE